MSPEASNNNNVETTVDIESQPALTSEVENLSEPAVLALSKTGVSLASTATIADGPIQVHCVSTKSPKDTLKAVYKAAEYKAGLPMNILIVQCFMAGIYISMAGQLYLTVGGGVLGSALFPTGLMAIVLMGAELFTGDALVFVAGLLGQHVSFRNLLRNWTVAWLMNFAGCLLWAGALAYGSGALEDSGAAELAVKVALKKANEPWFHIFLKGIGANFMVCIGVWQATCAEEVAGKLLALWFPISAFVMMGFDHCIANQFLIPVGMMYGANISITHLLFQALLPATLGNIVGGGIFVGAIYWYVYDTMTSSNHLFTRIRENWHQKRRPGASHDNDEEKNT